jgi:predicted aldo/keto reductase-like oxidoreductase
VAPKPGNRACKPAVNRSREQENISVPVFIPKKEYASLTRNGTSCVGCGDCLPACPQEISIADKLKAVHNLLG